MNDDSDNEAIDYTYMNDGDVMMMEMVWYFSQKTRR